MAEEPAYTLFPSDAPPAPAAPAPTSGFHTIQPFARPRQPAPAPWPDRQESPAAEQLFPTEKMPDPARDVAATLEPWALQFQIEGRSELAAEWRSTAETLAGDLRRAGTSQEDAHEMMQLLKNAHGNTTFGVVSDAYDTLRRAIAELHTKLADTGVEIVDLGRGNGWRLALTEGAYVAA